MGVGAVEQAVGDRVAVIRLQIRMLLAVEMSGKDKGSTASSAGSDTSRSYSRATHT